jgi:hypothetical protein
MGINGGPHFTSKGKVMDNKALNCIEALIEKNNQTAGTNQLLTDLFNIVQLIAEDSELLDEDIIIQNGRIFVSIDGKTSTIDEYFSREILHTSRMSKYNRGVIHGYESCLAVAEKWFGKKSKVYKSLKKDFEKMIKSDYDIDV